MMNAPAPAMALPYPLMSRQVIEHLETQTFTFGGGVLSFDLDRIGYLEGLLIHVTGTQVVSTASPAPKPGFPWNILKRIVLDTPGLADPIAVSGDTLHHQNLVSRDFGMDLPYGDYPESANALDDNAYHAANGVNLFPVAVATNAVRLWYFLGVRRNPRDLRGIVPLGNRQRTRLRITPSTAADLFSTTANVGATALTVQVYQVFRTAPPMGMPAPEAEASFAIVLDEYETAVATTGQTEIEIPTGGTILNVMHRVFLDDDIYPPAPEALIDDVSLWLNKDKVVDRLPTVAFLFMQNAGRAQPLPAGTFVHDFEKSAGDVPYIIPGQGERVPGWVFSDELNELTAYLGIATGAALDGARIVTSVKRLVRI